MASESSRRNSVPGLLSLRSIFGILFALLMMAGGAANAALPPVVEGNPQPAARAASGGVGMVEIYNRLQQLQLEVQTLRGELEEQSYTLDNINKRQRDLYMDLDRRIQQLESGGRPSGSAMPAVGSDSVQSVVTPPASPVGSSGMDDKAEYDQAFALLKDGKYDQAADAFKRFVASHSGSVYVPNALYWQGEAYYVTRQFDPAKSVFDQVLQQYPAHSKAKDAMLKIGYIHFENKNWAAAREMLDNVVSRFPGTSASRLAQQKLDAIKQ